MRTAKPSPFGAAVPLKVSLLFFKLCSYFFERGKERWDPLVDVKKQTFQKRFSLLFDAQLSFYPIKIEDAQITSIAVLLSNL